MNEVVFMLPNGLLSSGQRVAKLTKGQMKIVRSLSKMSNEQRDQIVLFSQVLQNQAYQKPFVGHAGKKLVSRDYVE